MLHAKTLAMLAAAFVAGSFVASPELRAYAANTVFSTDIVDGQVKTADLAAGAVTGPKIGPNAVSSTKVADSTIGTADLAAGAVTNSDLASNAVTGNKIADGTIAYGDVSRSFVAVEHRDDCNCGGTGWDPDGTTFSENIFDDRIKSSSVVSISGSEIAWGTTRGCWTTGTAPGLVTVMCDGNIPNGRGINYAIFNNPAYG